MLKRCLPLCLMVVMASGDPGLAGPIPSPLQGVTISATVSKDAGTSIFTYQYRVFNPVANEGQILSADIEITRGLGDAVLSREGLLNGPRYMRHSSENAFQRVPMVPVGISGPDGWTSHLGFDTRTPPRGFAGWGSIDEPFRILPGQAREGFRLTSYGLPGIRAMRMQPDIDYDNLPAEFGNPEKARQLRDGLIFQARTVGPEPPPQAFVPLEFLNYLITLLHDSRLQGWVRKAEAHQELLEELRKAKRRLEANDPGGARKPLGEFLREVREEGCRGFQCNDDKALTSEAYALLFFNGQFVQAQLPRPPGAPDDD